MDETIISKKGIQKNCQIKKPAYKPFVYMLAL